MMTVESLPRSRVKALLEHFAVIEDTRDPWRVAHPLNEILLLVVLATICDCEDYEAVSAWGARNLGLLRRHLPFHFGVPTGRWLTLLMNRINPSLFSAAFTDWVREIWPQRPELVAIDGKTSRRSHDRTQGKPPLHLVSAFATTDRLVLGQEAVPDKASETTAIPILIDRLAENDGLKGAIVSIDAIATNPAIAGKIRSVGADYLLAVKANQPTLRAEVEALFNSVGPNQLEAITEHDKGHGRIEERIVSVVRETDGLDGERRFPGETRLPDAACLIRVERKTELKTFCRQETRYYISSASLTAEQAARAIRGHWLIENTLHWTLDVVFADDQSRLRKGHGAQNMAVVRHFAFNLLRAAPDPRPLNVSPLRRGPRPGSKPRPVSLKLRRKIAGWDAAYLQDIVTSTGR
jgi:predicted transposase YbfD/YdcC